MSLLTADELKKLSLDIIIHQEITIVLVDPKDKRLSTFPLSHQSRYYLISLEGQRSLFFSRLIGSQSAPQRPSPTTHPREKEQNVLSFGLLFYPFLFLRQNRIRCCSCGSERQMPEHFSISPSKPLQPNRPGRPEIPYIFAIDWIELAPQRPPP
ncbi:hypothetical protein CEXT_172281 [Caerostris extrusa]|uniref:Uncharacterized protein n=1 Tax=Caerostris extrusa TaxID=172846 RepID=A0AAV4MNH3_CAEEX|nr:hypothetical protein CEXT_172281 [Caerostris extrusa]